MQDEHNPETNNDENREFSVDDILESWSNMSSEKRYEVFRNGAREDLEKIFTQLAPSYQAEIYAILPLDDRRTWIRILDADDVTDLIQALPTHLQKDALSLLDHITRTEITALLAYEEDEAGGLMNPQFTRLRPDFTVDQAIKYLYVQSQGKTETIYYGYVCDKNQVLLGVVSLRQLFLSPRQELIENIMQKDLVSVTEDTDQEEIAKLFSTHNVLAMPVLNAQGVMKGIVTFDDIVAVVQEVATEDIQKIGGSEALDAPYMETNFFEMVRKRAGWLLVLFLGEMFTATAMQRYEIEIEKAVVLALFIPLVISSGGNSGSQATTLIIRSLALGELRLKDWWRVFLRELASGLCLGLILGLTGLLRILLWPNHQGLYGPHYILIAMVVAFSLIGIVLWGTLTGSMLPFLLKRLKLDPATASAPFVATVVDVSGLVMYFTFAKLLLSGILL